MVKDLTEFRMSIDERSNDKSIRQIKVSHIETAASRSRPNADPSKAGPNRSSRSETGASNVVTIVDGPTNIAAIPAMKK